jgi:hypothetical protein
MQQLILGTGTAIWWLTEPHWVQCFKSVYPVRKYFIWKDLIEKFETLARHHLSPFSNILLLKKCGIINFRTLF